MGLARRAVLHLGFALRGSLRHNAGAGDVERLTGSAVNAECPVKQAFCWLLELEACFGQLGGYRLGPYFPAQWP
jgi:hypothetical protein